MDTWNRLDEPSPTSPAVGRLHSFNRLYFRWWIFESSHKSKAKQKSLQQQQKKFKINTHTHTQKWGVTNRFFLLLQMDQMTRHQHISPYRYTLSLLFLCVEFLGRWAMIRDISLLSPLHFLINFIIKLPLIIFLSVVPYTKLPPSSFRAQLVSEKKDRKKKKKKKKTIENWITWHWAFFASTVSISKYTYTQYSITADY